MEHRGLKIIIENKIPYMNGIFEPYAEVAYVSSDNITPELMKDADALITRTRTKVNRELLEESICKVVATATIGTDHIDLDWCAENGVKVINAPGCNAPAVAQYVFATIAYIMKNVKPESLTIGIVGVGNVGRIVERWAKQFGMTVLLNDPYRADNEEADKFVSLETIAEKADIITFHTPMSKDGKYPSYHLCSEKFIDSLCRKPLIINAARGAVADTAALLKGLPEGKISALAIDCWENEPDISLELLGKVNIGTPHIAGYSASGKARASAAVVKGVAEELNIPVAENIIKVTPATYLPTSLEEVAGSYDISRDSSTLKAAPRGFEEYRNSYSFRKEVGE